jgi:hypothetical protein
MTEDSIRRSILDDEHLKLLSLGYMISAGINAFFSLFGLMYMVMGIVLSATLRHAASAASNKNATPPKFFGWIFAGVGAVIFVLLMALAAAKLYTGFCIKRRKSRTFCMIVAGISCLEMPYGTLLGVLSFIVFGRDSVIQLFDSVPASRQPI